MTRVDELQQKYPSIDREILVKMDVHRHGIRDTEVLDKVSVWQRRLSTYQSYDHDVSLKEVAEKRPETARPGYILRLSPFHMKNGIGVRIERDSASPYEIKEPNAGQFALYEGEEKVEDIYFASHKRRDGDEAVTSKGTPVASLIDLRRSCFFITPVRFCEYFTFGEQCKFCNFNGTEEQAQSVGANRMVTIDPDDTLEAYKIAGSNRRFVEGRFTMGAFRKSEQEVKIYLDFVERIANAFSYKPNLSISTQPMSRKDAQRLKDAGLSCLMYQMEVWESQFFAEVCPGKFKRDGYERYLEAFLQTVDVLGAGNVGNAFIGGTSMMPANGHKSWQESRDSLIEGNRWMIKHGVFPVIFALRLGLGSVYGDDRSSRKKLPPTEYYLDAIMAHHKDMKEYGLYSKLNKLMYCPMDCMPNHYVGELGFVELAGNPAKWLADWIPDESNWLAQFLSSIETQ